MEITFDITEGWYQLGLGEKQPLSIPSHDPHGTPINRELYLIHHLLRLQRSHSVGHDDDWPPHPFAALLKTESEGRTRYFLTANAHIYHTHDHLERNCAEANAITEAVQALGPGAKIHDLWIMGGPAYPEWQQPGHPPITAPKDIGRIMTPCGTCCQKIHDYQRPDGQTHVHILPLNDGELPLSYPNGELPHPHQKAGVVMTRSPSELLPDLPSPPVSTLYPAIASLMDSLSPGSPTPITRFPSALSTSHTLTTLESNLPPSLSTADKTIFMTRAIHAAMIDLAACRLQDWNGSSGLLNLDIAIGRRQDGTYLTGLRVAGADFPASSTPVRQLADKMAASDDQNRFTDFFLMHLDGTLLREWPRLPIGPDRYKAVETLLQQRSHLDGGSIERMTKITARGAQRLDGTQIPPQERTPGIHLLYPVHPEKYNHEIASQHLTASQLLPAAYNFLGDRKSLMNDLMHDFDLKHRAQPRENGSIYINADGILNLHKAALTDPAGIEAKVRDHFLNELRALINTQIQKTGTLPPGVTAAELAQNTAPSLAVVVNCSGKIRDTDPQAAHYFEKVAKDAPRLVAVITGGGEFGLMQAFSQHSPVAIGITTPDINKPGFEGTSPDLHIQINTGSVDERMYMMRALGRAVTAYPGGIGTAEEIMDALCNSRPIILDDFHGSLIQQLRHMHEAGFLSQPAEAYTLPLETYLQTAAGEHPQQALYNGDLERLNRLRTEAKTLRQEWRHTDGLYNVHICGLYNSLPQQFHARFDDLSRVADAFVLLPGDIFAMREFLSAIVHKRVADKKLHTLDQHLQWLHTGNESSYAAIRAEWSDERMEAYLPTPLIHQLPARDDHASLIARLEAIRPILAAVYHRPLIVVNEPLGGHPFWQPFLDQLALYEKENMFAKGETLSGMIQTVNHRSEIPGHLRADFAQLHAQGSHRVTDAQTLLAPPLYAADELLLPQSAPQADKILLDQYYHHLAQKSTGSRLST